MATPIHEIPVASPAEIFSGWDGIRADDLYLVPVDPASLTDCDSCQ